MEASLAATYPATHHSWLHFHPVFMLTTNNFFKSQSRSFRIISVLRKFWLRMRWLRSSSFAHMPCQRKVPVPHCLPRKKLCQFNSKSCLNKSWLSFSIATNCSKSQTESMKRWRHFYETRIRKACYSTLLTPLRSSISLSKRRKETHNRAKTWTIKVRFMGRARVIRWLACPWTGTSHARLSTQNLFSIMRQSCKVAGCHKMKPWLSKLIWITEINSQTDCHDSNII